MASNDIPKDTENVKMAPLMGDIFIRGLSVFTYSRLPVGTSKMLYLQNMYDINIGAVMLVQSDKNTSGNGEVSEG